MGLDLMAGHLQLPRLFQADGVACYFLQLKSSACTNYYCHGSGAVWKAVTVGSNNVRSCKFMTSKSYSGKIENHDPRKVRLNVVCSAYGRSASSGGFGEHGDSRTQDLLVEMIRLEISKVQMKELLDKTSQNIQNIALQTQLEYAQLSDLNVKKVDASGSRVLNELDANASAILQEFKLVNADLEAESRKFEERQIFAAYSRNEGLFFKNLYKAPRVLTYRSNLSSSLVEKNAQLPSTITAEDFIRGYKQVLCGGLSLVILSFMWSSGSAFVSGTSMRAWKLISYGVILSLLLAQLAYARELIVGPPSQKSIEEKSEKDS